MNRFETSPNHLFPQKRSFHMTDESNFTVVGNRPTLENWELLKLNCACSTCKYNMPCILFSVVYECKPLPNECNINWPMLEHWELLKLNYPCSTCKYNMPCIHFLWYIIANLYHRTAGFPIVGGGAWGRCSPIQQFFLTLPPWGTPNLKMKPPPHLKNKPPIEMWSTLPWNDS